MYGSGRMKGTGAQVPLLHDYPAQLPTNAVRKRRRRSVACRVKDGPSTFLIMSGDTGNARDTRAGFVALVGRPNVGKSTLLNAFIGQKLSIVSPRPQTTRENVLGIFSSEREQIVFVDTPGLLKPRYLLQRGMLESALGALRTADLILLMLDAERSSESEPEQDLIPHLKRRGTGLFVAINKVDISSDAAVNSLASWSRLHLGENPHRLSAALGVGVTELRTALAEALPVGPFLYPSDEIAVQPLRFFVAELIRETVFEVFRDEIPYSTAVRVEEYRESTNPVYIRVTVFVERETQKAIIIGRAGTGISRLGRVARGKIEELIGEDVYLDIWVKSLRRWRSKESMLKRLGYSVPPQKNG